LLPILEALVADAEAGRPAALCTILQTKGSTPQQPGAALLVRSDMSTLGTLGGGCVEAEVRKRAFELLQHNRSALLDFLLNHDYGWDDGLICGGRMFIGVTPVAPRVAQPAPTVSAQQRGYPTGREAAVGASDGSSEASAPVPLRVRDVHSALELARRRRPASVPLRIEHEDKLLEYRLHLEVPPILLIAGAGHVGRAIARLMVDLDFHVVVVDDRPDMASRERLGDRVEVIVDDIARALRNYPLDHASYVVIVTRGHQHDHQALDAVVRRPAAYLGLIGSKRKSHMILKDLGAAGVPSEQLARVRTPIGLPIGAVTVPEIAVSVAAELVQLRRQNAPRLVEGPFELAWVPNQPCA